MVQNKFAKKKKRNLVDLKHIMSKPKVTKKRKWSMTIDYSFGPLAQTVCHDDKLSKVKG